MTSIEIPKSVTSIGDGAFRSCGSLTSIEIPSSVTSIGLHAFSYCDGLESITVDADNAVYKSDGNCIIEKATNKLILGCKNSVIPNYVTSIGSFAFYGCMDLTSIVIPIGITIIGDSVFDACYSLTEIYCEAQSKPSGWDDSWNPLNKHVIWGYKDKAIAKFQ